MFRSWRIGLAVLLAAGLWLRVWGLDYGLPLSTARPDEDVLIKRLLGFDTGDFNPHWFIYPTFYLYLLYGYVKAVTWAASTVGLVPDATTLADLEAHHPRLLYVLARSFAAGLGTATIGAAFALGRAVWDRRAGMLAAVMLTVSLLHVRDSHFFKPDAALALFTTLALLASVRLLRNGSRRAALAAGVACGLVLGTKYNVVIFAPALAAAVLAGPQERTGTAVWQRIVLVLVAAAVTVVATSPFMVIDYPKFAASLAYARFWLRYGGEGLGTGFAYHAWHSLLLAQGTPLTLFILGAVLWQIRDRRLLVLNIFTVLSAIQLGMASAAYTRYLTPVVPTLYVIAGVGLARLTLLARHGRPQAGVTAMLLLALLAHSTYNSIRIDQILAGRDTRLAARDWLDANVPRGTPILVLGSRWPYLFGEPALGGYRVRRNPTLDVATRVRYVVTHEHPLDFSRVPDTFDAIRPLLQLERTFSPFVDPRVPPGIVFEPRDAFYVPISGFREVRSGGPIVRIYSVKAARQPRE
jgi:hypothetical protein